MKKIRVLLADDHPAFREGLERLLWEQEDIEVIEKICGDTLSMIEGLQ